MGCGHTITVWEDLSYECISSNLLPFELTWVIILCWYAIRGEGGGGGGGGFVRHCPISEGNSIISL